MPAAFDRCVKRGGRVRTLKLKGGRYRRICYLGGKAFLGHVATKKNSGSTLGNAAREST